MPSLLGATKSAIKGNTQNSGAIEVGSLFSAEKLQYGLSMKRCKIGPCKVTTLRALFQNRPTCVFGARHKNVNGGRPTLYQRRRCSPVTLVI